MDNLYAIIGAVIAILGFCGTVVAGIASLAVMMFKTGKLVSRVETSQTFLEAKQDALGSQVEKLVHAFELLNEHGERITALETRSEFTDDCKTTKISKVSKRK